MSIFNNKKIIIFGNIIVLLILFCIFFVYNQSLFIYGHDRFYTFFTDISSFEFPSARYPALIINSFYQNILPNLFGVHPQDFRGNYIVCSIVTICFLAAAAAFASGFFVSYKKIPPPKKFLLNKENILLLPLCFLILAVQKFDLFCNFKESAVFLEYHGAYIFFFLFFTVLFQIILYDKVLSRLQCITYSFFGFLIGIWSEFINIPSFSTLLIIFLINKIIYRKNILKNKNILCLISGFLLGFIIFYTSKNYGINSFGTIGEYNIISHFQENTAQIMPFTKQFIESLFLDYEAFWTVFIFIAACFIVYLIKTKDKTGAKLLLSSFSLPAGFYITAYGTIIFLSAREIYLFNLYTFPLIGYHIVFFVSLILLGYLYNNIKNRFFTSSVIISLFISVYFMFKIFIPLYIQAVDYNTKTKEDIHDTEKALVIYSIFGEAAVFPEGYNNNKGYYSTKQCLIPVSFFMKNPYNNKIYSKIDDFEDLSMMKNIYKHPIKGYQLYPEAAVQKNMQKRIMYLEGGIKPEYNIFKQIKYKDIKEYDKINLSMQDIIDIENKYGKDAVLQKAEAYLYFKQKDYVNALKLYSEYNKQNPDDYDTLLNTAEIYKIQKEYDKAEKIYLDLYKRDKENLYIVYNLSLIFTLKNLFGEKYSYFPQYSYEYYLEGLLPDIQFIKAETYKELGNLEKAEKIILNLDDNYKKEFYGS